jgi:excisionase family DNA binding protein
MPALLFSIQPSLSYCHNVNLAPFCVLLQGVFAKEIGMAEAVVAPLLHRRTNAAQRLGISVRLLDFLLAERALKSVKVGRRRLVSEEAIQNYIKSREKSGE